MESDRRQDRLSSAHWRAHIVTPYHQCLRCNRQYNSSMVVMELDGSLDDTSYISNLSPEERTGNQNVFPFSLGVAGMEVNLIAPLFARRRLVADGTATGLPICHC